jgi:hypothetical protein
MSMASIKYFSDTINISHNSWCPIQDSKATLLDVTLTCSSCHMAASLNMTIKIWVP